MFTPQEVSEKAFPKASFGGYNMSSVDEFLDALTEDYTALYKENATLKAKLKVLAEKMEEYRATEDAMRSTLLAAQRMAAQMVEEAQAEKDKILADARAEEARLLEAAQGEAAARVAALGEETVVAEKKLAMAQSELGSFILRCKELCVQQAEFLTQLPEMELAPAEAPVESVATQDTVRVDTKEVAAAAEAAAAVEEEPAAKEEPAAATLAPAEKPVEETPFPADFRLDLEGLKFGRNYDGE